MAEQRTHLLQPPPQLKISGNTSENWKRFSQLFDIYGEATELSKKNDKVQAMTFLNILGSDGLDVYNAFTWDADDDNNKLNKIKEKFQEYCNPIKNITMERYTFNMRGQQHGENFDSFYTDIRNLSKDCEYGTLRDSLIRDRIVCGIQSGIVRARLLRDKELTLTKAIDACRAAEVSDQHLKALGGDPDKTVNAVKKPGQRVTQKHRNASSRSHRAPDRPDTQQRHIGPDRFQAQGHSAQGGGATSKQRQSHRHTQIDCGYCGRDHLKGKCPAYGAKCGKCGKFNHFTNVCFSRHRPHRNVHQFEEEYDDFDYDNEDNPESQNLYIGTVQKNVHKVTTEDSDFTVKLGINGKQVAFDIDTGAQCNVMNMSTYKALTDRDLGCPRVSLTAFGGSKLSTSGQTELMCYNRRTKYKLTFDVIDKDVPNIIGKYSSVKLGLVKRVHHTARRSDILSGYSDLFRGIGLIKGEYNIEVDTNVSPKIHPPRSVPVAIRDRVKTELDRMEQNGIIAKVYEPTDWVNSLVTVVKPNKVRICIDPRDLNLAIKREHHPMNTIEDVATRLHGARYFSVLDADKGFYQIKLTERSSKYTTFNTPFGRYCYLRMPMGIASAPEIWQRAMNTVFGDMVGVECVMDDILVWGATKEEHDERLINVLDRARAENLTLNRSKCRITLREVDYIGHIISEQGLKASPTKIQDVQRMPEPQNKGDVQRFLGMVTYMSKFIPNLSELSAPMRTLVSKEVSWHWDKPQKDSFQALKNAVTQAPVLKFYDPNEPVTLSVDASSKGLGAVLLQGGQPVAYSSKALTDTEQRYAQIEKEMLAIVHGCVKFHKLIYGRSDVKVETDHRPLEAIFKKPLHVAPMRLQKMMMKLQLYRLTVTYVPGKQLHIADALSRAFVSDTGDPLIEDDLSVNMVSIVPVSHGKLDMIRNETAADHSLQQLRDVVLQGWPSQRSQTPHEIHPYWNIRDEISLYEGILYRGERIIVPTTMRSEMLERIHESHLGIETCKRRARDVLYWPGMAAAVEDKVSQCGICQESRNRQPKEPLLSHDVPNKPWSKIASDLFHWNGNNYLLMVDYYSNFIETVKLENTLSKTVIAHLKANMARYGIIDELITDNGPQFSSQEFQDFTKCYEFAHNTSSPTYAQSNGLAEKSVQTMKNLLEKAKRDGSDPYLAVLAHRNTPISDTLGSPVQRLMGRRTRTRLPASDVLMRPKIIDPDTVKHELTSRRHDSAKYYNVHKQPLTHLNPGDNCRLRTNNGWVKGNIVETCNQPRSYIVDTGNGRYRRNRGDILKTRERNGYMAPGDDSTPLSSAPPAPNDAQPPATESPEAQPSPSQQPYVTTRGRTIVPPKRFKDYTMK